ncbi:hypothetical protein O0I10_000423 [Lichtheimia ornata]|uniref:CENP-T/Histone H4 histone fold domain-containing protein n=1 Tax=Lichtheimia ornata TaxID=688661 RepID=A0AAD7Y5N6_9FUNG|nr:uncharacterized protein O0I10_000423 [Lichtheimia ornata]KAJ8664144.1 hypothetical protein O0I10_000423 [Lichtheimia ornata]
MESQSYSQRDSSRIPIDSSDTQSQGDAKSLLSQKTGLSQGRASSTNDPLSPAKVMRQLGAFEMDTASQASSIVQSQSQKRFSRIGSRYQEDFLTRRSKMDPSARLEEFRQRYQFSRPMANRAPITTTTTTTTTNPPPDFSFRHRRDWRHNDLEDFDDLLTIKSYSTDTNFSAFNRVTQSSLQPQPSQQPQQQKQQQRQRQQPPAIRADDDEDEDMDDFEYRAPAPLGSGFSVLDDDEDDDNGPPHSWYPPATALYQQSSLKRRRLSHSNAEADIVDDIGIQKNDTMIPPPDVTQQERHHLSQQSKEELQHERIPTQRTRFITSQRSQTHDAEIPNPREQQPADPSNDLVENWLQSTDIVEKDKAITSSLQEQQQQSTQQKIINDKDKVSISQQSSQPRDIKGKGKADISQQSSQPLDIKGKDKADISHQQQSTQPPASSQREKEPTPIPNMDFEIDFDDMDFGGDDYQQPPSPSPQPQLQPPQPSSDVDHGEHVASSSRDNVLSEDNASIPEQRRLDPKALIQVHSEGRFGNQILAAADEAMPGEPTGLRRLTQLRQLGKIMFRKAAIRMSKETEERLGVISDAFYKQATDDLATYAKHAKRNTIKKEDAIMLLRRQERLTDDTPIEELAHKYLPRELWDEFCVSALAYNELYPKEKRHL